jgi:hypothetical protein
VPHPTWLADTFAVVMVAVSLYCIAWLIAARRRNGQNHVDVNVSHVAMGLGMAGMLVPRLNLLPDGVWEAVFVAIALWFSWQGVRFVTGRVGDGVVTGSHGLSHYLIHLVMALAMLYMYLATLPAGAATGSGMSMTAPTGATADFVGLPLLFVATLFASAVWQLDGLSRYAPSRRNLVGTAATTDTGISTGPRGSWEHSGKSQGETSQCQEPGSPEPGSCPQPSLAPRLEMGCHIAMCITMGYMLILVL